jgi:alanyl-tRNA synthetase
MRSSEARRVFLDFFQSKGHKIVSSAPMVVKDDPTLMFTNAGMNQFKDIFLGNTQSRDLRIANTQKCLRVSGKHNDLEEVGHDTYHHTMFEMLGNWSFGDYFKKEAIAWAWELLNEVYGLEEDRLYATVFEGDPEDNLPVDREALTYWKEHLPEDHILFGTKKDNFWEMGDTGPCGPCSEIHIDLREDTDRQARPGRELINSGHPLVVEIWNLVFIEFNRQSDGKLVPLPARHIDTGMGFERLCMALQKKKSNYDTDIFQPVIREISELAGVPYGSRDETDVAMRVVADHLRAIAFAIADGQLPSNTGAGYVIRRILRRAVRYGYAFLGLKEPFLHRLVYTLAEQMGHQFHELKAQEALISKVILEEEASFLRTLSTGIRLFEQYITESHAGHVIEGHFAFELFDTYGFPVDLTRLMASEKGWTVDMDGFNEGLAAQKNRSRQAAQVETGDWIQVNALGDHTEFLGYETLEAESSIARFRKVKAKGEEFFEIVLDRTPFYAESGGQVGDRGYLLGGDNRIMVEDTYKENDMIIHRTREFFADPLVRVRAVVDGAKRLATANNHSATHLMHAALRKVLGPHVEQRGSMVNENHLRFDFSHFTRMTEEETRAVEILVNDKIRENIPLTEHRDVPIEEAKAKGARALFGEKYGDHVRTVAFDEHYSLELCGGTHVPSTGQIGLFKIISEGAIAAGVRRIEAVTGRMAEEIVYEYQEQVDAFREILKGSKDLVKGLKNLVEENRSFQKKVEELSKLQLEALKAGLLQTARDINGMMLVTARVDLDARAAKDLAFMMKQGHPRLFLLLVTVEGGKVGLTLLAGEELVGSGKVHAGEIIKVLAREIRGGGGGQPHFATAGGTDPAGIPALFKKTEEMLSSL